MKRGLVIVLFLLVVILPVVVATPPAPYSVLADDGTWIPVAFDVNGEAQPVYQADNQKYKFKDKDLEGLIFEQHGVEGQYVEVFEFDSKCPVAFKIEEIERDGEIIKRPVPFFATLNENGEFEVDESQPVTNDFDKDQIKKLVKGCGFDELKKLRPNRPDPRRKPDEMWSAERTVDIIEKGIGVEITSQGQLEYLSPIVTTAISDVRPPNLKAPKPIITGAATTYIADFEPQEIDILVLLVQFSDVSATISVGEIEDNFFGPGGLGPYLEEQSYGAFTVNGVVHPTWFTLPNTMGYYGGNYEANIQQMVTDAIDLADPEIDFSQFDSDFDGIVDGFFLVHAGAPDENGGGNSDEIWSHYFSIPPKTVDGVRVIDYETVSEESPVGIIAHEFGHYLGLPDMYDTVYDDGPSKGTGEWSVMGYGGYLDDIGSFDPWSKGYLGWLNDDNFAELGDEGVFELVTDDSTLGIRYYLMDLSPSEFFMIENRHTHRLMNGETAGGILIWHVDESVITEQGTFNGCRGTRWDCNAVNGDANHKLIDIEAADGENDLDNDKLGDKKDPWYDKCSTFGGCQPTEFLSTTNPSSAAYSLGNVDVAIVAQSAISSSIPVSMSFSGQILGAPSEDREVVDAAIVRSEEDDDVSVESGEQDVRTTETSTSTPTSTATGQRRERGGNTFLFIVIGIIALVVLGVIGFIISRMGGNRGSFHPGDFHPFRR